MQCKAGYKHQFAANFQVFLRTDDAVFGPLSLFLLLGLRIRHARREEAAGA